MTSKIICCITVSLSRLLITVHSGKLFTEIDHGQMVGKALIPALYKS